MRLGYVPALDGLRAVAIAAVVLHHAFRVPAEGRLGVDLFFVLSGFLITTLLLEERVRTGAVSLFGFYRRRVLRLVPALLAFLAVYLTLALLFFTTAKEAASGHIGGVLVGVLYVSNFVNAGGSDIPDGLEHLWSLSAEEQFYLLWPALLLLFLVAFRGRLWPIAVALVVGILGVQSIQLYLLLTGGARERLVFGPDTRGGTIMVGCLLAVLLVGKQPCRVDARVLVLALSLFGAISFRHLDTAVFTGPLLLFGIACAVLVVGALDEGSLFARALSIAPLVFLGRISYALYLWHMPIFVWLGTSNDDFEFRDAAAIALAVATATASYYLVELPFLRRKRRPAALDHSSTSSPRSAAAAASPDSA